VEQETGIKIEIFGFDMGTGLPPPRDYRDLPYLWQSGYYRMEKAQLEEIAAIQAVTRTGNGIRHRLS
jgi:hypothetical protein